MSWRNSYIFRDHLVPNHENLPCLQTSWLLNDFDLLLHPPRGNHYMTTIHSINGRADLFLYLHVFWRASFLFCNSVDFIRFNLVSSVRLRATHPPYTTLFGQKGKKGISFFQINGLYHTTYSRSIYCPSVLSLAPPITGGYNWPLRRM